MHFDSASSAPRRVDIFCRVIDNLGDAGVCWRLARELHDEYGCDVQLVIDVLLPFAVIEPLVELSQTEQRVNGINVVTWERFAGRCDADLVIEAFACDPPEAYVQSMAQRDRKPLWINLEYLSAEAWVDGVHGLPSPHPKLPLTKFFFVPGFSEKSGGLLRERSVANSLRRTIEKTAKSAPKKIFAFAYPHAPLQALEAGFNSASVAVSMSIAAPIDQSANHWHLAPRVSQRQLDVLLAEFDVLLVRGEDSFVRAQFAAKPMLWHIYPTEDRAHIAKLDAWLDRYCASLDAATARIYRAAAHAFVATEVNDATISAFTAFAASLPKLNAHAITWRNTLVATPSLVERLVDFYSAKTVRH
jgi:hypothetical protein